MTDIKDTQEAQQCFYADGFLYCNYVVRNETIIKGRSGWLKFPVQYKKKNKIAIPKEIATLS